MMGFEPTTTDAAGTSCSSAELHSLVVVEVLPLRADPT